MRNEDFEDEGKGVERRERKRAAKVSNASSCEPTIERCSASVVSLFPSTQDNLGH